MRASSIIAALLLSLSVGAWAEEPLSILGYTSAASFWAEMPKGWQSDTAAAKKIGAIFVLLPKTYTFNSAPIVIVASAYHNTTVENAMSQDSASFVADDPAIHISSVRRVVAKKGAQFTVRQFRSEKLKQQGYESVAYHQEGPDVVVLTLSAQFEPALNNGIPIFDEMLATFESSKIKVKVEQ